jgi:hypothetical protein
MTLFQSQNVACHSNTAPLLKLKKKKKKKILSRAMKAQRHLLSVYGNMQDTSAKG